MGSTKWWLVRCEGGSLFEDFVDKGVVALGGEPPDPNFSSVATRECLYTALEQTGKWSNPRSLGYVWGVVSKFLFDMSVGDQVATYDPTSRTYKIGRITGNYAYSLDRIEGKQHFRSVDWEADVPRDALPDTAKNSLASMQSVIEMRDDVAEAFSMLVSGGKVESQPKKTHTEQIEIETDSDIATRARELVKDAIAKLDWDDMEELVAGLLRAMGYKTRMSERGSDRGRDILASPDGLGFENPRIVAEVKHRQQAVNSLQLRGFIGGLSSNDRGLYVSTGGFTRDARYEADRSSVPVTMVDIEDFARLLLEHYAQTDSRVRTILPLTQIWWPL